MSWAVFGCLFAAALIGMLLRKILPEHHLGADTKDTVKLAMGLVATMAALVLGLLIAATKDKYDKEAAGITQMAAKAIYLDRILANYGPESKDARDVFRTMLERVKSRVWPDDASAAAQLDPSASRADSVYRAIQSLSPRDDFQSALKAQALSLAFEIGQMRWQEFTEMNSEISKPLLYILTFWLSILFVSFGMFAPSNSTVVTALLMAALAVSVAIFLMMELNTPFGGLLRISSAPFDDVLAHLGQ
jgi:hypothetical protein